MCSPRSQLNKKPARETVKDTRAKPLWFSACFVLKDFMGTNLIRRLESAIEKMLTDDNPRSAIIEMIADQAGISSNTVNQILTGDVDCPPEQRIRGIAEATNVSFDSLMSEREKDGCDSSRVEAIVEQSPVTLTGKKWLVTALGPSEKRPVVEVNGKRYIESANRRLYDIDFLKTSPHLFEGARVYDDHASGDQSRSPGDWIGVLRNSRWDESGDRVIAELSIVDESIKTKLLLAKEQGVLGTVGLSISIPSARMGQNILIGDTSYPVVEGFDEVGSVDFVMNPAAGGRFGEILESKKGNYMSDKDKFKEMLAGALGEMGITAQPVTEEKSPEPEVTPPPDPVADLDEWKADFLREFEQKQGQQLLETRLADSNLSESSQTAVRAILENKGLTAKIISDSIDMIRKIQAVSDPTGSVTLPGQSHPSITEDRLNEIDMLQVTLMRITDPHMFDKLQGLGETEKLVESRIDGSAFQRWVKEGRPNPATHFAGIKDIYRYLNGLHYQYNTRLLEAESTSTLASIIKNTVNIFTAAHYSQNILWWSPIVRTMEVEGIDDVTLVKTFGTSELPIVETGGTYLPLQLSDGEEVSTHIKHGGFVEVPEEVFLLDKINYLQRIPEILSDSWVNTLSTMVAGVFTVNSNTGPVLTDTGALFNDDATTTLGGHLNLLTTALSHTSYDAAYVAMGSQTDRQLPTSSDPGKKMLIKPGFLLIPLSQRSIANQIRNSDYLSDDIQRNPHQNAFEIIIVPDWTDTNDFALVANPDLFPAIYTIFPRGSSVPSIDVAIDPTQGSYFTNDTFRYKVKMRTYEFSTTYRCAPVVDFRSLHKSNVT